METGGEKGNPQGSMLATSQFGANMGSIYHFTGQTHTWHTCQRWLSQSADSIGVGVPLLQSRKDGGCVLHGQLKWRKAFKRRMGQKKGKEDEGRRFWWSKRRPGAEVKCKMVMKEVRTLAQWSRGCETLHFPADCLVISVQLHDGKCSSFLSWTSVIVSNYNGKPTNHCKRDRPKEGMGCEIGDIYCESVENKERKVKWRNDIHNTYIDSIPWKVCSAMLREREEGGMGKRDGHRGRRRERDCDRTRHFKKHDVEGETEK